MSTMSIADVVRADLCIGCGLCESVTGGRVRMKMTAAGSLRPDPVGGFAPDEEGSVLAACPGVVVEARDDGAPHHHPIWGAYRAMALAWAGDAHVRFRASTGGVLTALGQHLLRSGMAASVLHVGPEPAAPARSRWVLSRSADDVLANSGSRYGPTAPLAGLGPTLERGEPFAIIAKPCDLGAVHRFARSDERVDRLCVARLAMVCGGQSRLTKTTELFDRFGLEEHEIASLRYRGNGNPGPTSVETLGGEAYETSYLELWGDEARWDLETRCKLCPDALGECADIAALDTWPGGAPADHTADDDGYNAIVVRTRSGVHLLDDAVAAGALVLGDALTPEHLDEFQPHQVRKKRALAARFEGVAAAGVTPIQTIGLRVDELGRWFTGDRAAERDGTRRRMIDARR